MVTARLISVVLGRNCAKVEVSSNNIEYTWTDTPARIDSSVNKYEFMNMVKKHFIKKGFMLESGIGERGYCTVIDTEYDGVNFGEDRLIREEEPDAVFAAAEVVMGWLDECTK